VNAIISPASPEKPGISWTLIDRGSEKTTGTAGFPPPGGRWRFNRSGLAAAAEKTAAFFILPAFPAATAPGCPVRPEVL